MFLCALSGRLKTAITILSLYVFFIISAYYQQKIYNFQSANDSSNGYTDPDPPKFSHTLTLISFSSFMNCVIAYIVLFLFKKKKNRSYTSVVHFLRTRVWSDSQILRHYLLLSVTMLLGRGLGYHALTLVDYSTQTLLKCAKPVSIIVIGLFHFKMKFAMSEILYVGVIVAALLVFNFANHHSPGDGSKVQSVWNTVLGNILLLVSLTCDGLTGSRQDILSSKFDFQGVEMLFTVNIFITALTAVATLLLERFSGIFFILQNPTIITDIVLFAVTNGVGNIAAFVGIANLGSLLISIINTTRKLFLILCSVVWIKKKLSPVQWGCIAAVFIAVIYKTISKSQKKKKEESGEIMENASQMALPHSSPTYESVPTTPHSVEPLPVYVGRKIVYPESRDTLSTIDSYNFDSTGSQPSNLFRSGQMNMVNVRSE